MLGVPSLFDCALPLNSQILDANLHISPKHSATVCVSLVRIAMRKGLVLILLLATASTLRAYDSVYERPPIDYLAAQANDPVARLAKRLNSGQLQLPYDPKTGYLPALLRELKIPVSSQTLVFSKTSFQRDLIGPDRPRALYFNDGIYVGYVQGGDVLEITATDPTLGPIFYTVRQKDPEDGKPLKFARQTDSCLQCHASSITQDMPGHIVRSVYPDAAGQPILSAGTFRTNHTSPLKERWGGWYVTGTSGAQKHMGNVVSADKDDVEKTDFTAGTNVTDVKGRFDTSAYLSPHSDIVALMVLEHQTYVHNLITRANYLTRVALHDAVELNKAIGRPANHRSDSTNSRIKNAVEPLLKAMLFVGEAKLTGPIAGTSGFTNDFAGLGLKDAKGRSLRDLDLKTRLFKHPLSYLIYGDSFDALPKEAKDVFFNRLHEVLTGKDTSRDFEHLSPQDRATILETLKATKPNLPESLRK